LIIDNVQYYNIVYFCAGEILYDLNEFSDKKGMYNKLYNVKITYKELLNYRYNYKPNYFIVIHIFFLIIRGVPKVIHILTQDIVRGKMKVIRCLIHPFIFNTCTYLTLRSS